MRACSFVLCLLSVSGCDKLFSLTHVAYDAPDAPADAAPCEPRGVATGQSHTCAIDKDGGVWCWGENSDGQVLPNGPGIFYGAPSQVVLPAPAMQIAVGRGTSCARLESGAVWCWGYNEDGELGTAGTSTAQTAVEIAGIPASAEIAIGGYHVCSRAASDGTVWCWGRNDNFESGVLDTDASTRTCSSKCTVPHAVPQTLGAKGLALGHRYSCIIDSTDHVQCWGNNKANQLGDSNNTNRPTLTPVPQLGTVGAISASGRTTCAVELAGSVRCWGRGGNGELGNGIFNDSVAPVPVQLSGAAVDVELGTNGACARLADGTLECWGNHDAGDGVYRTSAAPRPSSLTGVTQLASHFFHSCAIAGGTLSCWGANDASQLGRGARAITTTPQAVSVPATSLLVAAGFDNVCSSDGSSVYCWGENDYGQSGGTDLQRVYKPTLVPTSLTGIAKLVASSSHTCALAGDGHASCWGKNNHNALDVGAASRSSPPTAFGRTDIVDIGVGINHTCVLSSGGPIYCYGYNGYLQLGTSSTAAETSTVSVNGTVQLAIGGDHSCARTVSSVFCWGHNADGQLGNGSQTDTATPQGVNLSGTPAEAGAGGGFTCVRNTVGEVYCWGRNSQGQLGVGDTTRRTTPAKVNLPAAATKLFVGYTGACVLGSNNKTYCWGAGGDGQIGNGMERNMVSPTEITSYAGATAVSVGGFGACAIVGGAVQCTGRQVMLGNGDQSLSMPMPIALGSCR